MRTESELRSISQRIAYRGEAKEAAAALAPAECHFDYTWEVYKPEAVRKWGYYVLPVFYGDCFVARVDSRVEKGIWTISRWWWVPDVTPDAELLDALRAAVEGFLYYLRADGVRVGEGVDEVVRQAILRSGR